MRRPQHGTLYLKYICGDTEMTHLQRLFLINWFLDQAGYPRSKSKSEIDLGCSKRKTKERITDPLIELRKIKFIHYHYSKDGHKVELYDLTEEYEQEILQSISLTLRRDVTGVHPSGKDNPHDDRTNILNINKDKDPSPFNSSSKDEIMEIDYADPLLQENTDFMLQNVLKAGGDDEK